MMRFCQASKVDHLCRFFFVLFGYSNLFFASAYIHKSASSYTCWEVWKALIDRMMTFSMHWVTSEFRTKNFFQQVWARISYSSPLDHFNQFLEAEVVVFGDNIPLFFLFVWGDVLSFPTTPNNTISTTYLPIGVTS